MFGKLGQPGLRSIWACAANEERQGEKKGEGGAVGPRFWALAGWTEREIEGRKGEVRIGLGKARLN